jgi:hypothetical protein
VEVKSLHFPLPSVPLNELSTSNCLAICVNSSVRLLHCSLERKQWSCFDEEESNGLGTLPVSPPTCPSFVRCNGFPNSLVSSRWNELAFSCNRRDVRILKKLNHARSTISCRVNARPYFGKVRSRMDLLNVVRRDPCCENGIDILESESFRFRVIYDSVTIFLLDSQTGIFITRIRRCVIGGFHHKLFGQPIYLLLKVDTIVWEPSMISWMGGIDGSKWIARRRRYAHMHSCNVQI